MTDTVYAELWRDLVERFSKEPAQSEERMMARWAKPARASGYTEEQRRRDRDDPLMHFVLDRLEDEDTDLDGEVEGYRDSGRPTRSGDTIQRGSGEG